MPDGQKTELQSRILNDRVWEAVNFVAAAIPNDFSFSAHEPKELVQELGQKGLLEPLKRILQYGKEGDIDFLLLVLRVTLRSSLATGASERPTSISEEEWQQMFELPWTSNVGQ